MSRFGRLVDLGNLWMQGNFSRRYHPGSNLTLHTCRSVNRSADSHHVIGKHSVSAAEKSIVSIEFGCSPAARSSLTIYFRRSILDWVKAVTEASLTPLTCKQPSSTSPIRLAT